MNRARAGDIPRPFTGVSQDEKPVAELLHRCTSWIRDGYADRAGKGAFAEPTDWGHVSRPAPMQVDPPI
jgi:hypothetical protein